MSTELDKLDRETAPRAPSFAPAPVEDDFPLRARSGSRRMVRVLLWTGALVLTVSGGVLVYSRMAHAAPQVHYETVTADRGSIAAKVTATGSVSALLTVQVGSQVSGRVQQLFADYNSTVKKGQTIAKLDPLLFEAAVAQGRALLLSAEGNLKKDQAQETNAKISFDRAKSLQAEQIIAQSDLDSATATYEAAAAQVEADQSNLESARAVLNQAQVNLDYTTIVSPIDGTVISRNVDVGQTVAASFQAPTIFVIAQDLRRMQVDTNVGEADIGRLTAGMPASFTVDAYPQRQFIGKLRQIRNAAQTLQNVVTYDAVIDVENPDLALRPGMTANVTFIAAQKDGVVRLRNAALRFQPDPQLMQRIGMGALLPPAGQGARPDPNRRTVWLLRDGKPAPVVVTAGVSDGTWSELVQGDVQPGDVLITDMTAAARRSLFSNAGGG
jgi:HlyD family secretion protein